MSLFGKKVSNHDDFDLTPQIPRVPKEIRTRRHDLPSEHCVPIVIDHAPGVAHERALVQRDIKGRRH